MTRAPLSLRRCPSCGRIRHPAQHRVVMVRRDGETRRARLCIFCENPKGFPLAAPMGKPRPAQPGPVPQRCNPRLRSNARA
jgi:hypothetical protein